MTPKEQIKVEAKRVSTKIKDHFKCSQKLISDISLLDTGVYSKIISENIINQIFFSQKEVYFNSEFNKFKTVIEQQIVKAGLKPVEYTLEYLVKNLNAELPSKKFTHSENVRAYEISIKECLDSLN